MQISGDSSQSRKPSVPAPTGAHVARVLFVIDLGTQESSFNNGPVEHKRKVQIGWELVNTTMPQEPNEAPKPFVVSKEYNATLKGEKSNLRKLWNAVWGVRLSDEEAVAGVDFSLLIGKECMVNVVGYLGQDKTMKSKPDQVMQMMQGVQVPMLRNKPVDFSIGAPNQFDLFPEIYNWIREMICKSPEFQQECQKFGTTAFAMNEQAKQAWKNANPLPAQGQQQQYQQPQQPAMQPNQQFMNQGQPQYQQPAQPQYQQPQQPYQQQPQYPAANPYPQQPQHPAQQPQQPQRSLDPNAAPPQQQGFGQQQPQTPQQQPGFGHPVQQ